MAESWEMLTARELVAVVKDPKPEPQRPEEESSRKITHWTGSAPEQAEVKNSPPII